MDERMTERLFSLAALEACPEDLGQLGAALEEMIQFIDEINTIDTEGAEEMTHPLPLAAVLREDEAGKTQESAIQSRCVAGILGCAPRLRDGLYEVPVTITGGNTASDRITGENTASDRITGENSASDRITGGNTTSDRITGGNTVSDRKGRQG